MPSLYWEVHALIILQAKPGTNDTDELHETSNAVLQDVLSGLKDRLTLFPKRLESPPIHDSILYCPQDEWWGYITQHMNDYNVDGNSKWAQWWWHRPQRDCIRRGLHRSHHMYLLQLYLISLSCSLYWSLTKFCGNLQKLKLGPSKAKLEQRFCKTT